MEEAFRTLKGVIETTVGYMGGTTENPSYQLVCSGETGHAEVVDISFDPAVISYSQLLERFWSKHNPTTLNRQGVDIGTQYRSAIFYYNDEQRQQAEDSKSALEKSGTYDDPVVTEIVSAGPFWPAEEYHQKYILKHNPGTVVLKLEIQTIFTLRPFTRVRLSNLLQLCAFLLLLTGVYLGLMQGSESLGYNWQWNRVPRYLISFSDAGWRFGPLLQGLWLTMGITAVSLCLSLAIGLISALMRLSNSPMARGSAWVYLELIRNTPLLIQIFIIYFVFAPILDIGRFSSAVLALSLFEGAYASEIIRAGILAIPAGQWEASASLGMSSSQSYRHIILPQALRQMIPPLTSQGISLVKDSALVSTIAIYDLTMQGQQIIAETFLTFEIWFVVAAIYLAVTMILSILVKYLEYRLSGYEN